MLPNPPPIQNPIADKNTGKSTQFWTRWFTKLGTVIGADLAIYPPTIADADANPNSIYYSSTTSKLTYKDANGTTHPLF